MRRVSPYFLAVVMVAGLAGTARASVIFQTGNHPQADEANIFFRTDQTSTTVTGEIDSTGVFAQFTSSQTLDVDASGQADIAAASGNLTNLSILVPDYTFGDFILNLFFGAGNATVTAFDPAANPFTYTLNNGQNFLTVSTDAGTRISSISISAPGGFRDLKQPRISNVCSNDDGECLTIVEEAVPEPSSLILIGTGLIGAARAARRRQRRA